MTSPPPPRLPAQSPGPNEEPVAGEPHLGRIVDRRPTGGGHNGRLGAYVVEDEDTGRLYTFDYTDIVTEGFRTIRTGERVRFHLAGTPTWRAQFVIRLDQPDPEAYYQ